MKLIAILGLALTIQAKNKSRDGFGINGNSGAVRGEQPEDNAAENLAYGMNEYDQHGPMDKGQQRANDNQGIVINNNVAGGGCEMEGISKRVAEKIVEMMMEYQEDMMEDMDAENAGKKKNGKKSNKLSLDEDSNNWWNSINGGQE